MQHEGSSVTGLPFWILFVLGALEQDINKGLCNIVKK